MQPVFDTPQTFIIAEAGVNHNGDLNLAKQLIQGAKSAGADAVKFQMFEPEKLASKATPLATYQADRQEDGQSGSKTQVDLLKTLSLPREAFAELQAYCQQLDILFLCTPFDEGSAQALHTDLRVPTFKISSGEVTNLPFLRLLSRLNVPVMLSTGMATLDEVRQAVAALESVHQPPLGLLHCVSSYPAPAEAVNLNAIQTLQATFPHCVIGYSDHTLGVHIPVAAVAKGARIIEKHFTLDKTLPGPDHKASLSVEELKAMVRAIRETEQALGDGIKQPHAVEADCIRVARKSLVARYDLPAEHLLTEQDLLAKRPGTGISPALLERIVGKRLPQKVHQDELLPLELLENP
jgi:N,N'-diacetyllegionaminate synthase